MEHCAEIGGYESVSHFARAAVEMLCEKLETPLVILPSTPTPSISTVETPECNHPAGSRMGTLCTACGTEVM